jgi:hypothetical protein
VRHAWLEVKRERLALRLFLGGAAFPFAGIAFQVANIKDKPRLFRS